MIRDCGDGTFDVAYDDGESETRVEESLLRLIERDDARALLLMCVSIIIYMRVICAMLNLSKSLMYLHIVLFSMTHTIINIIYNLYNICIHDKQVGIHPNRPFRACCGGGDRASSGFPSRYIQ